MELLIEFVKGSFAIGNMSTFLMTWKFMKQETEHKLLIYNTFGVLDEGINCSILQCSSLGEETLV